MADPEADVTEQAEASAALADALVLWSVDGGRPDEVIDRASRALAIGLEEPWMLGLALLAPGSASSDVEEVLTAHPPGSALPVLPRGNDAAVALAITLMAHRCLAGDVAPSALVSWACQTTTDRPSAALEQLVHLDYEYDVADYANGYAGRSRVDQAVMALAGQLASGP